MSTTSRLQGEYARQHEQQRNADFAYLVRLDAQRRQARTVQLPAPERRLRAREADVRLYEFIHELHAARRPRTLTVPEIAHTLNVTRARIYQILQAPPTLPTVTPAPAPSDVQLPETDL